MDALMRLLLAYARTAVAADDGFAPFGASMAPDGELETSASGELDGLREELRRRADRGELLAVGVCTDVVLDVPASRAIRVELEHREAAPLTCVLPYELGEERPTWGELTSMPGERRTWDERPGGPR
jgi:hypothetical protein